MLTVNSIPSGSSAFYSAVLLGPSVYIDQLDILENHAFIEWVSGDPIKPQISQNYPLDGKWKDEAFKAFFNSLEIAYPEINCGVIADAGVSFLFGYAVNGDISQFQGALFTFSSTP